MRKSNVPKIVVGAVLAAVYGTGLAMVTLRDSPEERTAQTAAVAPTTQVVEQPAVMTEAPAPVATAAAATPIAATREAEFVRAEAPRREMSTVIEQVSPSVAPVQPEASVVEKPVAIGESASVGKESDDSADAPSAEEGESESAGDDSQTDADTGT